MKRLLTDKRVWAAVLLAATIILAAAGVKVPANIVAAIEAVIAAIPSPADVDVLTPAPSPAPSSAETGEGSADIDHHATPVAQDAAAEPPDAGAPAASGTNDGDGVAP